MATEFSLNAVRFEDIRQGIVTFLKENNTFTGEFDFEGSNIGYQIDIAAYITMLMSYQNILKSNNIFIDTSEIRKNVVSIAKTMGYRPKRKVSSRFSGTLEFIGDSAVGNTFVDGDTLTIPARTQFTSSPNGRTFINLVPITLTYQNSILLSGDFTAVQGAFKTLSAFGTGKAFQSHTINSVNVENDNLLVSIRSTNTDTSQNVRWTRADAFFSTTDPEIYFVEEDIVNEKKPKILFGDGLLGQVPTTNETIVIEYLETIGDTGNGETGLAFTSAPSVTQTGSFTYSFASLSLVIPDLQTSFGGLDNESITDIQFNAPRFFSAGDRGVTKSDILTLLADFPSLLYYNVIGGPSLFENDATQLGLTYIAAVPAGISESDFINNTKIYLTETEENTILPALIEKTVVGTERLFIKPTYIYLELDPVIEIATSTTDDEVQSITTNALTALTTFNNDNLKGLEKNFRLSNALTSLTGTTGVISAEIDVDHNFIITGESFYDTKDHRMTLPIIFDRDSNNNLVLDEHGNPVKTNFVKLRTDIITDENEKRDIGLQEISNVSTVADVAGSLDATYFIVYGANIIDDGTVTETSYYIWYNVDAGGNDPTPAGISLSIAVPIASGDTAGTVAAATNSAINNSADAEKHFTSTTAGNVVSITNANTGKVTDTAEGAGTGFAIEIITQGVDSDFYNQFTLPQSLSSIYGSLNHRNSDRYMYNIDVADVTFIEFELIGAAGSKVLAFDAFSFKDQSETNYQPNLFETGTGTWSVQLNGRNIATLTQDSSDEELFTLSALDNDFLENTLGFAVADTGTEEFINLSTVTETDENNTTRDFYRISGLLTNEIFTDIRIWGKTKFFDTLFDASTFTWSYTDLKTFKDSAGADAPLTSQDLDAIEENFIQVTHPNFDSETALSMKSFNGAFSLANFLPNNDALNVYTQRNDLVLTTNYTIAQSAGKLSYEVSAFSAKDASAVQTITLNAKETTTVQTENNAVGTLNGTWFNLYSANDAEAYYVWFDSTPSSSDLDPAPSGKTGIVVNVVDDDTANTVAGNLQEVLDAHMNFTASVVDNLVTIVNVANGKSIDTFDSTVTGQETQFTFTTTVQGADNPTVDMALILENDILRVSGSTNVNNNGDFLVSTIDIIAGTVDVYNYNAVQVTDGVGTLTHYKVATGTYGSFTVHGFDIYHDISIGTLEYANGDLVYDNLIKGYTDLTNNKTKIEKIKTIFDNYDATTKMDSIGIIPIDLLSNSGLALGQRTDFDEGFSQSIQALISTPIVKK